MKMTSIHFLSLLSFCLCLQTASIAQAQDSLLLEREYHVANTRIKLQLREFAFNLTPFIKSAPWLSIGAGYRFDSKFYRQMDCVFGEPMLLKGSLKGPFVMAGFDSKNWGTLRLMNYSALVGYKRLNGGRIKYIERDCFVGASSESRYKLYDATANEVFFKFLVDFQHRNNQYFSFYLGFGGAFQEVRKAFVESGSLQTHYTDDDVEKVLYFIPLGDMGIRINFIGLKTRY